MQPPMDAASSTSDADKTAAWHDADPAARRSLIVEAALALLQEQGLAAVTMRAVAGRLGVGTMTLYTYVEGQHGLYREMVRCGFEMLNNCCEKQDRRETPEDWLKGAKTYLDFALQNPNLYKLMFDQRLEDTDDDIIQGGFQPYLERVTQLLAERGIVCSDDLPREARRRAGRLWITLHGLAMLAIAGRLSVLGGDLDTLLADLLPRVGILAEDPPRPPDGRKK